LANEVLGKAFIEIHPKIAEGAFSSQLASKMGAAGSKAADSLGRSFKGKAEREISSAITGAASQSGGRLNSKMASIGQSAGNALSKALGRGASSAAHSLTGVEKAANSASHSVAKVGSSGSSINKISGEASKAGSALGKTSKEADNAAKHVSKVGDAAHEAFNEADGKAHKMLIGTGAALTGIGIFSSQLASNEKASMQQVQGAVEESGKSWEQYKEEMEKASKGGAKFGFTADQTSKALAQLTRLTKDPEKALQLLNVTEDVAVAKHMKL
jgi:hypothetical protein